MLTQFLTTIKRGINTILMNNSRDLRNSKKEHIDHTIHTKTQKIIFVQNQNLK